MNNNYKSAFISIIGKPNVGKSTLLNSLLNEKIAITSPKVQTTRHLITGILNKDENQFIFIDTPGIHKPLHSLGKSMEQQTFSTLNDVDLIMWVVDRKFHFSDEIILNNLKKLNIPVCLVINKIDLFKSKSEIDEIILSFINRYNFDEVIPISAKDNTHLNHLINSLKKYLKEGPLYYPKDYITDQSDALRISELIREKILYHTKEEIPHSVFVKIENMTNNKDLKTLDINALVYVERNSQKGILIGKDGSLLKKIGKEARLEINKIFNLKSHLEIFVRVEKNWRNNPRIIKSQYEGN
ncbi:MAG: GTPase Era [Acholeplasmataceae bacterium]